MDLQESIKKWVSLDNSQIKITEQLKIIKDEKNYLTNNLINYFNENKKPFPKINISDGKLNFIEVKQYNTISYKFLEECLFNFYNDKEKTDEILNFIKTQRKYNTMSTIKRS
jgi:diacylglycerol kinase family enzyme